MARLGYGAMRLTGQPGNWGPYPDPAAGIKVLRRAVELGVTLIDTAHAYGPGFNEALVAEALHPYPKDLVITTKCGIAKVGPGIMYRDGRPKAIRTICEASLKQLRLETIDLLQLHWVDEDTPIEESVGAIADLVQAGKVRHIGISNVTLDEFERARGARRRSPRCRTASASPAGSTSRWSTAAPRPVSSSSPMARSTPTRSRKVPRSPSRRAAGPRRRRARLHPGPAGARLAARAQPDHGPDPGHDARSHTWRRTSPPPRSG